MLTGLDHVVVAVAAIEPAIASYRLLLGRRPCWRAAGEGGVIVALFKVGDIAIELMAPDGDGPVADRLRAVLDASGEGLASLAFATDDMDATHALMQRRGLEPEPIISASSFDAQSGHSRAWRRTRVGAAASGGTRLFVLERDRPLPDSSLEAPSEASATALDHAVIRTQNPDRTAALYGARLGLDLRLDRATPAWGARFQFFRCGQTILEIVQDLKTPDPQAPDHLWGLTWKTPNAAATRARLAAAGVEVSPLRPGRKPATEVFTVKSQTCSVPTLFLQAAAKEPT
ncbi:MAG: VOC family protein [Caulobacterales bacterium]|jgi:catechol 2,3-dioxygenase-like lactoylglutathione lyase family enzyme